MFLNLYNILLEVKKGWDNSQQLSFDFGDSNNDTNLNLTIDWVREHYNEFNAKYFDGALDNFENISFRFINSKNTWGLGGVTNHFWNSDGTLGYGKTSLALNSSFSYREEDAENSLIHEMVHIYEHTREPKYIAIVKRYQHYTNDFPKDGHGTIFYREAQRLSQYGFNIQRFISSEESANARLSLDKVNGFKAKHSQGVPLVIRVSQDGVADVAKVLTKKSLNNWINYSKDNLLSQKVKNSQPKYISLYYAQNIGLAEKDFDKKTKVGEYSYRFEKKEHQSAVDYLIGRYDLVFGQTILSPSECKITEEDMVEIQKIKDDAQKKEELLKKEKSILAQKIASNIEIIADDILKNAQPSFAKKNAIYAQNVNTVIGKVFVELPYISKTYYALPCLGEKLYLWSDDRKLSTLVYKGVMSYSKKDENYENGINAVKELINQAIKDYI